MSSAQHEAASFVKNNVLISGCSTLCSFSKYRRYSYIRTQQCNMVSKNSLLHNISNHQYTASTIYCNKIFCSFLESLMASWGVAQWIELWLLTTRAGVRIPVLTNAMHKFVELYALNQITLPLVAPGAGGGYQKNILLELRLFKFNHML